MILGRNRLPYGGPSQASPNFRPSMPHTHFLSQNNPFNTVMRRTAAYDPFRPMTQPLPIGPAPTMPTPPPAPITPAAAASPIGPAGALHGAFGSTGGTRPHFHMQSPYAIMRQGMIPGVHPSANNLRRGVRNARGVVRMSMPFQTRPLPPPPPPPPAPVAVAPSGVKGLLGSLFHPGGFRPGMHPRPRRHRWWQLNPPSTQEQVVAEQTTPGCETYPPRADGVKVTVCNGRAVRYEDAQGNVTYPRRTPATARTPANPPPPRRGRGSARSDRSHNPVRPTYPNPDAVQYPTGMPLKYPCQMTTRAVARLFPMHQHGAWLDKDGERQYRSFQRALPPRDGVPRSAG